jgi:hypothetical protein
MPAYDALFSHIFVKHNVQIGNVKLIDETTGRISNSLVSVADVNNASLNALADGKLSNIDDAISLINLKLGDVETLWQDVYYPNDTQITIMNLTSYIDNLHNEVVTIQSNTDLTPLVSNIDINREKLGNLQTNFTDLKSIVLGKDGNDTTTTPGLVNRVGLLEAAVGNIQMDVDLTPLVSNIDINRERLGNLQGNVTTLEAVVGNIQMDVDLTPLVSNIDINREKLGNLQTNFTDLKSIVLGKDGNDTTTTPGLVNRVGLLEAAVGNIQMDVDLTPLVSNIDINRERLGNLQGNVTTLEAVVGNIQMDVDLTPLVSNIDINRERLGNLQGNVTNLESVVLPGLVGNVTALQTSVADMRGGNVDSSINLSMLYTKILDLQAQVDVLKDPFSVQVVSSTTTEIKMRLQGRSSGDITVNIGGQNFNIQNYDGNSELLVTDLQPNTIYDVTVTFANPSFFTYYIQMSTK